MISINIQKTLFAATGKMQLALQLEIKQGQLVTLYGVSGVGKTSTLRMLAGLLKPDAGQLKVGQELWYSSEQKVNLKPQERQVGMVFQDYALFPNMTVLQNLEFALGKQTNKKIIKELIEVVELGDLQHRKPSTLSGGQQQRVALARALVQQPKLLLLDEPLSALDQEIRSKLQAYILQVHRHFKLTTILVSHDKKEIVKLSDWIFVLEKGQVKQQGHPISIFEKAELNTTFKLTATINDIQQVDHYFLIDLLIQDENIQLKISEKQGQGLQVGDRINIRFQATNPSIFKIDKNHE